MTEAFLFHNSATCSLVVFKLPRKNGDLFTDRRVRVALHDKEGYAAASIWFEIWGVVDQGPKNFDFPRQIDQKFRYFSGTKIS